PLHERLVLAGTGVRAVHGEEVGGHADGGERVLHLVGPQVRDGIAGGAALVGGRGGAEQGGAVQRRAVGLRRHRPGRPAVVGQRAQQRVGGQDAGAVGGGVVVRR